MDTQKSRHDNLSSIPSPQTSFHHQNFPPSSPPASPPRYQRNHSNSLTQSLTESFDPNSAEAKSIFLASSVLRSYPPALQGSSSRHHRLTHHHHSAAPPSPPESLIISQSVRQSRSASTVAANPNPMSTAALVLQPAVVIEPLSFRDRLNTIGLPFRRGKQHPQKDLETGHGLGLDFLDRTPSLTLTTTHSPSQSLPTTAQHSADTAQTSLYSNTFPIPCYPDSKAPSSIAGSDDSFDLPTYYNGSILHSKESNSLRSSGRQSGLLGDGELGRTVVVRGGEVRIDIQRPSSHENKKTEPPLSRHLRVGEESNDSYSRHGASGSATGSTSQQNGGDDGGDRSDDGTEEWFNGNPIDYERRARDSVPIQSADLCIKGLQHRRALKNLKHPSEDSIAMGSQPSQHQSVRTFSDSESSGPNSEDYLDEAVEYFTNYDQNRNDFLGESKGSKIISPESSSPGSPNPITNPSGENVMRKGATGTGSLTPAKASSSVLNDPSFSSLNIRSNSSASKFQRTGLLKRNDTTSSSDSPTRVRGMRRPDLYRNLTTQTNTTTSSIALEEAESAVLSMGVELSKRLSGLSSSGGSNPSRSGSVKSNGFGAGLAVVVTADGNGGLSDVRSRLFEIQDEDNDDEEGQNNRKNGGGSRTSGKGKSKMVDSIDGGGESSQSEKEKVTSTYDSEVARETRHIENNKENQPSIKVHPGDDRFDYVYRLRAASPDNQPILVPHYKYPTSGSFPNRNAFTVPRPVKVEPPVTSTLKKQPAYPSLRQSKVSKSKDFNASPIELPEPAYSKKGCSRNETDIVGGDGAGDFHAASSSAAEDGSYYSTTSPPQEGAVAHFVASSAGMFSLGSGPSNTSNPNLSCEYSQVVRNSITDHSESAHFNRSPPLPPITPARTRGGRKGRRAFYPAPGEPPMDIIHSSESLSTPVGLQSQTSFQSLRSIRNLGRRFFRQPSPHLYRIRTTDQKAEAGEADRAAVSVGPCTYPMTEEAIGIQRRLSRILFACCLIFPPCLLILGYGGMDALILQLSKGEVECAGPFEKRLALWTGFISGAAVIGAVIGAAIVLGLG